MTNFFRQVPFFKPLHHSVISNLHLFSEQQKYDLNQLVFQEGQKANYVAFVRKGSFELTQQFSDLNHLDARQEWGALKLKREVVKIGNKFEKIPYRDEESIVSTIVGSNVTG